MSTFLSYPIPMHENKNTTNTWNMPQNTICGYMLVSAFRGGLASGRDISYISLS